jgi:exodeoxyribonuclease VII large subunit
MSDENIPSSRGRWDHLLREIPTQPTKNSAKPETAPQTQPPEPQSSMTLAAEKPVESPNLFDEREVRTHEEEVFSVSDINRAIKQQLEGRFSSIWVQGEISNFKAHTSGHFYFSLKDDKAQVNAVMFRGFNSRLKFQPESGMEVLVRGKISVYEPRGNYQVFCENMEPVGAGALQKAFEQLKQKLSAEGLFAEEAKKPIPDFPKEVGVVTSPTGAAIQDILNVLGRRSKGVNVTVIPARVQGEGAAEEIVRGIELAQKIKKLDVLIVGRGGGSIEDLWCFNEEIVARAIYGSRLPIISAVGHEIDFTIADFVADLRAPTPSAAAEVVAKSEQELLERLQFFSKSLRLSMFQRIKELQQQVQNFQKRLIDPERALRDLSLRLDDWTQRLINGITRHIANLKLENKALSQSLKNPKETLEIYKQKNANLLKLIVHSMSRTLDRRRQSYQAKTQMLDSLSPLRTVDRGYGIIRQGQKLIPDITKLQGDSIEVELRDGFIDAEIIKIRKKEES